MSSSRRLVLPALVFFSLAGFAGCGLDGDVLINTQSGDLGQMTTDDLNVTTFDMGGGCGLNTCQSMGATCGPIGDGCGNVINCGSCMGHETCGGGGVPFQCGGSAGCIPLTCMQLNLSCGPAGDGCGGTLDCGSCNNGETCGGAGVNGKCGAPSTQSMDMAGGLCTPKTCAQMNATCGQIGDGCGKLLTCGTMAGACPVGQTCGGGGVPFQCGSPPCVPKTCAQLGIACGAAGDGCGGLAKDSMGNSNCGGCAVGQSCGGSGVAGQCGSAACVPKTCAMTGANCGQVSDGCGGIALNGMGMATCGTCTSPQACGAGGFANQCGVPACIPKTCAQLGYTCGQGGDGCGGLALNGVGVADCGTCPAGQKCGALQPNQCGNNIIGNNQCDGGSTTIEGWVVAPTDCSKGFCAANATAGDPINNASVYVPSGAITALPVGVPACDQCSAQTPSIVQASTDITGHFVLTNPPTGPGVKVVIQLGRWRRVLTLNVTPCTNNLLTYAQTRLPRIQGGHTGADDPMDNIPRLAISTGGVDAMECVLRKMGIADSEFTNPSGGGRVQIYKASSGASNGSSGAVIDNNTPADNNLWGTAAAIDAYDAVLFPCTGGEDLKSKAAQDVVTGYANNGGRVFATHYSYVWTYNTYNNTTAKVPWGCGFNKNGTPCTTAGRTIAAWDPDTQYGTFTGFIDTSFATGSALSSWLKYCPDPTNVLNNTAYPNTVPPQICASTTAGQIPVNVVRWDADSVLTGAQQWMYSTNPPNVGPAQFPLHFSWNTDVTKPAAQQCGRVVYSDFHVEDAATNGKTFPTECGGAAPLTAQEKLLEYMLFDLTSCVSPQVPTCTPKTCAQLGFTCGQQGDTCGGVALNGSGVANCGSCPSGQVCTNGTCTGGCVPKTCAQLGATCGQQGDGCGGIALNGSGMAGCGTCPAGKSCVGGQCVGTCVPLTCTQLGATCGQQGDGCGGFAQPNPCGTCTPPQTCGGGGVPNQCGGGCVPLTCAQLGATCGQQGDGCGGIAKDSMGNSNCGNCTLPQTCGGGGMPNQCGAPPDGGVSCMPLTCAQQGLSCGAAGDGCGKLLDCGPCPPGQTCGGGGVPGKCGAPNCVPTTCAAQNADCGIIGDGCGGSINCGTCVAPQTCGGGGIPFKCGIIG